MLYYMAPKNSPLSEREFNNLHQSIRDQYADDYLTYLRIYYENRNKPTF